LVIVRKRRNLAGITNGFAAVKGYQNDVL
jgi:hypothetical protein